jgi:hypothetical protein
MLPAAKKTGPSHGVPQLQNGRQPTSLPLPQRLRRVLAHGRQAATRQLQQ